MRKLNTLSFVDFLKYMLEKCDEISHIKNSNIGYFNAKELIRNLIKRYMTEYRILTNDNMYYEESNSLFKIESLLDSYRASQSNKAKKIVIEEFKTLLNTQLIDMIQAREKLSINQYSA